MLTTQSEEDQVGISPSADNNQSTMKTIVKSTVQWHCT